MGIASSIYILLPIYLVAIQSGANALALRSQNVLVPPSQHSVQQPRFGGPTPSQEHLTSSPSDAHARANTTAEDLLYALGVMQDAYFDLWQGTWPTSIDWTAAVLGTHVSATLGSLSAAADADRARGLMPRLARDGRAFENLINYFFDHTSAFYFGENAVSLRAQAYDDMMWVVLGWLENIKFQALHSDLHYNDSWFEGTGQYWHGTQFRVPAAHRARLFYGLASAGWDERLCGGGMIWNPRLTPYKNAITNELYISSSIGMYLYFPGDTIDSPFMESAAGRSPYTYPHDPADLKAAKEGYAWLQNSNMMVGRLYADGFHISGWESAKQPGTMECDVLNPMLYTYNQGVILSGLRGLWLATLEQDYLRDAHDLMGEVIAATGWPNTSSDAWAGLGRGGVLEDACDSSGTCSQDGQTFKGIFFHHLAELCRPLRPQEVQFLEAHPPPPSRGSHDWQRVFRWHEDRCGLYRPWIEHNAKAALVTKNKEGKFGMWWGIPYGAVDSTAASALSPLPPGAVDYRNYDVSGEAGYRHRPEETAQNAPAPAFRDLNDRGRGRTVETQSGGIAVMRALYQWKTAASES
ncbi:Glycosyl hydrolase [Aspergillus sp. HF37]|nr:Glycosyl hydrolase [Aspergillus sp. HF37]